MYIFLIITLGLLLRLINIDKPEGLWNDEYVSWFVASTPLLKGFWKEVFQQCHMPLYYLFLKPFANSSDLILRLTSTFCGLCSIPVMFLIGKEFSKKCAFFMAILTAISPFLIYYSQEVRFYSLLFLLSALSLLFTIRLVNNKKAIWGYIISNTLIIFTHILGFIYVLFNLGYVLYKKKYFSQKLILSLTIALIVLIPFGTNILKMIPSSQWWGNFSYTNILFLFSDFISPILTNHINAPQQFFYSRNFLYTILLTIPTIIGIIGLYLGAKKAKGIFAIAILTIFIMSILAVNGIIVFITKYSIEILPIIIMLIALGFSEKKFGMYLISSLIAFQLFSVFTPFYPSKTPRNEGHKLVGDVINSKAPDQVIFTYYDINRFKRYLNKDYKNLHISKINRFEYIDSPTQILANINTGEKVCIVFLDSVSFIPDFWIENAKKQNMPEMFITFSSIRHSLTNGFKQDFTNIETQKNGSWTILCGTKK